MNAQKTTFQILATPRASASTLYGLYDLLSTVGVFWEFCVSDEPPEPRFTVQIVGPTAAPFRCASGVLVEPDFALDDAPPADVIIVPGMNVTWKERLPPEEQPVFDWLIARHHEGTRVTAACTGAIYLAETGLLDGLEVTTNWAYDDLFLRLFPKIRLRTDQTICFSHPREGIVTAGATTGWQELALFLIANYAGVEEATRVAKLWLIGKSPGLQKSFAARAPSLPHGDTLVGDAQVWVADNYTMANPVQEMTARTGLPPTTFARRFRKATGQSPQDYVLSLRIEEAKQLLETTQDSVEAIGRAVGYEDPASFRRLFKRKSGLTPSEHRRMFGRERFAEYVAEGAAIP